MANENKLVHLIKEEQQRFALEALSKTVGDGKDIKFEFGKRQGYVAGLDKALELILKSLRDERDLD